MNKIKSDIFSLADQYQTFLLDLYGVIWGGTFFLPDALDHMQQLRKMKKRIVLLSNYPCRAETVEDIWQKRGMLKGTHFDKMITSGEVAYHQFKEAGKLKYYMVGWHPLDIFKGTSAELTSHPEEADFIFCGEPMRLIKGKWHEQDTIDFYKPQLEKLSLLKKPMLCANPDKISDSNDKLGVAVRAGALASYYQKLGGHVDYIGKPYANLYDFALQDIDDKSSVLMVGDTLETDILGAQNAGIDSALTHCGMTARTMHSLGFRDIAFFCKLQEIMPTHIIKAL